MTRRTPQQGPGKLAATDSPTVAQRLLRTRLAWALSGLSYTSAVMATHGSVASREGYLQACRRQMSGFRPFYRSDSRVLEYGCGLGGNLIAIAPSIGVGSGLDVNPLYLWHARALSKRFGGSNLGFRWTFDGRPLAAANSVDFAFSIGVFERLHSQIVSAAVRALFRALRPEGRLAAYFLTPRALNTAFSSRLGNGAYVCWSDDAIQSLITSAGGRVLDSYDWGPLGRAGPGDVSVAKMVIGQKTQLPQGPR